MRGALLFDLDDTLVVEEPAAVAAFEATAQVAAARCGVDAATLAVAARARARDLWYSTPVHAYCLRVGISSWEGLWCRFDGDEANARWLRAWSPTYRRQTWRLALAEHQGGRVSEPEGLEGPFVGPPTWGSCQHPHRRAPGSG